MSKAADFLVEIGTEELPPKALKRLSDALTDGFVSGLDGAGLGHGRVTPYADLKTSMMGVGLLWVGWFGFNAGSQVSSGLGTAQAFESSTKGLLLLILMAVVVIYIVLGILYESFVHPITIISGLPSAAVGPRAGVRRTRGVRTGAVSEPPSSHSGSGSGVASSPKPRASICFSGSPPSREAW